MPGFQGEGFADSQRRIFRAAPVSGRPDHPGFGLGIEVVQAGKGATGKKVVADITDSPLHASLFIATSNGNGSGFVTMMTGKTQ